MRLRSIDNKSRQTGRQADRQKVGYGERSLGTKNDLNR